MRSYNMRLNLKKCNFGVGSFKFFGNVKTLKIEAILDIKTPHNVKEVHMLAGCLAALNRFISRMGDKCKPFSTQ